MSEGIINNKQCLERARELVCLLEAGQTEDAEQVLNDLTHIYETEIFQELGKLTRELHDTLSGFQMDSKMADIMENELPDAKERLDYVIQMTDRAAHKTLTAVEESIPICDEMVDTTNEISDKWRKFLARDMTAEQFRDMAREISAFLDSSAARTTALRACLNDILIAQDYQDLTGQTIRRVITLVQDVQDNLINFIKISSRRGGGNGTDAVTSDRQATPGLQGPQIPGREDNDAMQSQDEVDDLLSSLGF
ncbi:MAG: protein phosphatase CheZ [Gammaproteobacteria bacterium]